MSASSQASLVRWRTWHPSQSHPHQLLSYFIPFLTSLRHRILNKRGYTCHIDWWSLGVCAYELAFGRRPFRGRTNSDLTYSISKDPLKWPEDAEKKCSRTGMQVLRGVRVSLPLSILSPFSKVLFSFLSVIRQSVSVVNLTGKASKSLGDIRGLSQLIGTPSKPKSSHHLSSPM